MTGSHWYHKCRGLSKALSEKYCEDNGKKQKKKKKRGRQRKGRTKKYIRKCNGVKIGKRRNEKRKNSAVKDKYIYCKCELK